MATRPDTFSVIEDRVQAVLGRALMSQAQCPACSGSPVSKWQSLKAAGGTMLAAAAAFVQVLKIYCAPQRRF